MTTEAVELNRQGKPKPSIGRAVHYRNGTDDVRPAVVVKVHSDTCVDLEVFGPNTPNRFPSSVELSDEATLGTWFWPPRV